MSVEYREYGTIGKKKKRTRSCYDCPYRQPKPADEDTPMDDLRDAYDDMPTSNLFNLLLTCRDEEDSDSVYWKAVWALRWRATADVFDAARSLCESPCPLEQRIGCDVLAQLGYGERPFAAESFPLVAAIAERTDHPDTLSSALRALGFLGDPRGVDVLLPFLPSRDPEIRLTVAQSLGSLPKNDRCINGLILLSNDAAPDVRDWATFALGSLTEADTPAIRQTLLDRLADADATVRGEAMVGLAMRQDARVIAHIERDLEAGVYDQGHDFAREALAELHDIEQYPQLEKWKVDEDSKGTAVM